MTQITALKEEISSLTARYSHCDRSERFNLRQEIDAKKTQLVIAEREEIIQPVSQRHRLLLAMNSIEKALNALREIQSISASDGIYRCIDDLEQAGDRVQAEIGKRS